jgi:hypothetical protein
MGRWAAICMVECTPRLKKGSCPAGGLLGGGERREPAVLPSARSCLRDSGGHPRMRSPRFVVVTNSYFDHSLRNRRYLFSDRSGVQVNRRPQPSVLARRSKRPDQRYLLRRGVGSACLDFPPEHSPAANKYEIRQTFTVAGKRESLQWCAQTPASSAVR